VNGFPAEFVPTTVRIAGEEFQVLKFIISTSPSLLSVKESIVHSEGVTLVIVPQTRLLSRSKITFPCVLFFVSGVSEPDQLPKTKRVGIKTVYIKFKDAAGNISEVYNDTITWDKTKPTASSSPDAGNF
jgi:hypothetical protein